jgi:hypothetical protein
VILVKLADRRRFPDGRRSGQAVYRAAPEMMMHAPRNPMPTSRISAAAVPTMVWVRIPGALALEFAF